MLNSISKASNVLFLSCSVETQFFLTMYFLRQFPRNLFFSSFLSNIIEELSLFLGFVLSFFFFSEHRVTSPAWLINFVGSELSIDSIVRCCTDFPGQIILYAVRKYSRKCFKKTFISRFIYAIDLGSNG